MKKLDRIEKINKLAEEISSTEKIALNRIEYIMFLVSNRKFVIELKNVVEVVKATFVTPIPRSAPYVLGLINLRNEIITVCDLGLIMGFNESEISPISRFVITKYGSILAGFLVDMVSSIIEKPVESIKPVAEIESNKFLKGAFEADGLAIGIIDFEKLMEFLKNQAAD